LKETAKREGAGVCVDAETGVVLTGEPQTARTDLNAGVGGGRGDEDRGDQQGDRGQPTVAWDAGRVNAMLRW